MKSVYKRLSLFAALTLLLCTLPIHAGAQELTLGWEQAAPVTPGQELSLVLSLPGTDIAGGFIQVSYDATLFTPIAVSLAQNIDILELTWAQKNGYINILLDAAHNVSISGELLILHFALAEEIQPGTYDFVCSVPDVASFYSLADHGSALPLAVTGCVATVAVTDPPLPPSPVRYLACQEASPADGTFSVRLCAAAENSDALVHYGFLLSITDAQGDRELTVRGSALTDQISGGGNLYTADELGIDAMYTAMLTLAAEGEARITVTPYATVGDQTLYGGTYTIVYCDSCYITTNC